MSSVADLDRFCGFAERFLTDESSRPLVIEPWQREIFAGTRELVTLVSKKNGKTSLFAGLALWHAITTAFADVAILAASRDQAGKLLSQLTGYIKRSPELREQLRITQRIVHCDRTDGKVAVMAADSDTLDGWGGTLALVDELGRHKSEENFGLLRDGLRRSNRSHGRHRAPERPDRSARPVDGQAGGPARQAPGRDQRSVSEWLPRRAHAGGGRSSSRRIARSLPPARSTALATCPLRFLPTRPDARARALDG